MNEGGVVQWFLVNDGTAMWPQGTTLRLVGGPVLMEPVVEVPLAEPGQTIDISLEVKKLTEDTLEGSALEVAYCLVTPCGQPFGEVLTAKIAVAETQASPPVCVVLTEPQELSREALQGELKLTQWTLANMGTVPWPEDAHCQLFYNTPGFAHLPGKVDIPQGVGPGMTVEVNIPIKVPEQEGHFKAMWAVVSASTPEFGDVLVAEFEVGEFPFMEWMLAEEAIADSVSDNVSEVIEAEVETPAKTKLSATHLLHNHLVASDCNFTYDDNSDDMVKQDIDVVSLGHVSGLTAGTTWILEVVLANDGDIQWPQDTMLKCCVGDGFGCMQIPLDCLKPGESGLLQMELKMPQSPSKCAWTLTTGRDGCFGPVLFLDAA